MKIVSQGPGHLEVIVSSKDYPDFTINCDVCNAEVLSRKEAWHTVHNKNTYCWECYCKFNETIVSYQCKKCNVDLEKDQVVMWNLPIEGRRRREYPYCFSCYTNACRKFGAVGYPRHLDGRAVNRRKDAIEATKDKRQ